MPIVSYSDEQKEDNNSRTFAHFIPKWARNSHENYELIKNAKRCTIGHLPATKSTDIILCSSGPTLEENIDTIIKLRQETGAPIFCIHSNLSTLLRAGLHKDLNLVLTDSSEACVSIVRESLEYLFKPSISKDLGFLITHPAIYPTAFKSWPRPFKLFLSFFSTGGPMGLHNLYNFALRGAYNISHHILQAGSSATTLIALAYHYANHLAPNLKNVHFFGFDFAWQQNASSPASLYRCHQYVYKPGFLKDYKWHRKPNVTPNHYAEPIQDIDVSTYNKQRPVWQSVNQQLAYAEQCAYAIRDCFRFHPAITLHDHSSKFLTYAIEHCPERDEISQAETLKPVDLS
jgi:hypothetical protein